MSGNALYYPYIHIRDVDWLKGTLLLFPQVRRMLPAYFSPSDAPAIREFVSHGRALLEIANLGSERVRLAQIDLAAQLERDAEDPQFLSTHGRAATRRDLPDDSLGFQIHQGKLRRELTRVLRDSGLAWNPASPEPYDVNAEYVELHPRVGEAVMSTLAVACALGEGLDIVGDRRSGSLHRCLIEKDPNAIYKAWLHPEPAPAKPDAATGEELFEFMIGFACDLTRLTPEALASMGGDREPVRKLVSRLRERAAQIPRMDPGVGREGFFRDEVVSILKEWDRDRANMANFWRTFFGKGLVDAGAKFLEKAGDKTVSGILGGGVIGAWAGGTTVASLATASMIGGGAGLVIGLAVHAGTSFTEVSKRERESHYRYLSIMQKAGVVFRSDVTGFG
jgi:hypothetical protein